MKMYIAIRLKKFLKGEKETMKIIDFEKKGNVVRFYLGEKTEEWGWTKENYKDFDGKRPEWLKPSKEFCGDDWDDRPYEHNAGLVYNEFIKGHRDIFFDFDDLVLEPCNGVLNSGFSKDDMADRRIPCIIVVPKDIRGNDYIHDSYMYWIGKDGIIKYYFGDEMEVD